MRQQSQFLATQQSVESELCLSFPSLTSFESQTLDQLSQITPSNATQIEVSQTHSSSTNISQTNYSNQSMNANSTKPVFQFMFNINNSNNLDDKVQQAKLTPQFSQTPMTTSLQHPKPNAQSVLKTHNLFNSNFKLNSSHAQTSPFNKDKKHHTNLSDLNQQRMKFSQTQVPSQDFEALFEQRSSQNAEAQLFNNKLKQTIGTSTTLSDTQLESVALKCIDFNSKVSLENQNVSKVAQKSSYSQEQCQIDTTLKQKFDYKLLNCKQNFNKQQVENQTMLSLNSTVSIRDDHENLQKIFQSSYDSNDQTFDYNDYSYFSQLQQNQTQANKVASSVLESLPSSSERSFSIVVQNQFEGLNLNENQAKILQPMSYTTTTIEDQFLKLILSDPSKMSQFFQKISQAQSLQQNLTQQNLVTQAASDKNISSPVDYQKIHNGQNAQVSSEKFLVQEEVSGKLRNHPEFELQDLLTQSQQTLSTQSQEHSDDPIFMTSCQNTPINHIAMNLVSSIQKQSQLPPLASTSTYHLKKVILEILSSRKSKINEQITFLKSLRSLIVTNQHQNEQIIECYDNHRDKTVSILREKEQIVQGLSQGLEILCKSQLFN
eukprot:403368268